MILSHGDNQYAILGSLVYSPGLSSRDWTLQLGRPRTMAGRMGLAVGALALAGGVLALMLFRKQKVNLRYY